MSEIRVDTFKAEDGIGAPSFPNGIQVTGIVTATVLDTTVPFLNAGSNVQLGNAGVVTATTFKGNIEGTTGTFTNVSVGGTLTYEDVTNVDSLGIVTARIGVNVPAGEVAVGNNIQLGNAGVATATLFSGPSQIGIQSGGVQIGAGITQLNFIGVGNTFAVNGTTVNVSIAGGAGAGGTWGSNAVGVHTDKIVGINTTTVAGSATSEGALQVRGNISIQEGLLTLDSNIHTSVSIGTGRNALLIGPTTVAAGATIDIATGSTLVVV